MTGPPDPPSGERVDEAARSPAVTVIIPTRGARAPLLQRAVCRAMDNGYPGSVSVLVVADGVPVDVVRQQAPTSVDVVGNNRTPGLPGARNSGLMAARTELVAFCDDDDEWVPGKLERQVQLMSEHADVLLVGCGITIVQGDREMVRRTPGVVRYEDLLRHRVMGLHSSTLLMRREELVSRVGLLDEDLPGGFGEDYDLLLRVALQAPVLSVDDPYVRVHWHGSSYYFSRWATIASALTYLLGKHPDFTRSRRGHARLQAQTAVALGASGRRAAGLRLALQAFLRWPFEARNVIAVVVALWPSTAGIFQGMAHRAGRGL